MAKLESYITVGRDRLRCGYTTGTCAAAASLGAARRLVYGAWDAAVSIRTPAGIAVTADLEELSCGGDWAMCAVRKDGGDDPDVTDGALVFSRVRLTDTGRVEIDGGEGVGRVTRPGLDQPVGSAAINSVPRTMIREALDPFCAPGRGFLAVISVPGGDKIARSTFNPRLGITGGISILGTSGIVRPMSEAALVESVRLEIRAVRASGADSLLLTPGNYGSGFARDTLRLSSRAQALCSNYIGEAIDCAAAEGFASVLLVGHLGKLIKVAGGAMNTHSRVCDGRRETFCAHAALCGAGPEVIRELFAAPTSDAAADILRRCGLLGGVMASITGALEENLRRRAGGMRIEAIFFTNRLGVLGETAGARELMDIHRLSETEGEQ